MSHLQVTLNRGMEERLVKLNFSSEFDRIRHCGLLYTLKSIRIEGQLVSIGSEFLSDGRQRVRLDGKASVLVDVVS